MNIKLKIYPEADTRLISGRLYTQDVMNELYKQIDEKIKNRQCILYFQYDEPTINIEKMIGRVVSRNNNEIEIKIYKMYEDFFDSTQNEKLLASIVVIGKLSEDSIVSDVDSITFIRFDIINEK